MKDISNQLHPHVLGSHLRRVSEQGNFCDEAEFRNILGDWFNLELYDLEQITALRKLIWIFKDPSVNLHAVGRRLEQILEEITGDPFQDLQGRDKSLHGSLAEEPSFSRPTKLIDPLQVSLICFAIKI